MTDPTPREALRQLWAALERAPVMSSHVHPLLPLCLPSGVEIAGDVFAVVQAMDDIVAHSQKQILITDYDRRYSDRFPTVDASFCPSGELISENLPLRLVYARTGLLTTHRIADRIVQDVHDRRYQVVALMLVDGLSYEDTKAWGEHSAPCFVDGPSKTFDYVDDAKQQVCGDIGFPAIVGSPSLARRLVDQGIRHSRGYSYWDRDDNKVSEFLFQSMPLARVRNTAEAFTSLETEPLSGVYIQVVREGLDSLAHRRREVSAQEIESTVEAIHEDYQRLANLLAQTGRRGAAYLTADHGLLWIHEHKENLILQGGSSSPRYSEKAPSDLSHVTRFNLCDRSYYLYHYPHLGSPIPANSSAVHGGLSYWESIVPFVRVEVNV